MPEGITVGRYGPETTSDPVVTGYIAKFHPFKRADQLVHQNRWTTWIRGTLLSANPLNLTDSNRDLMNYSRWYYPRVIVVKLADTKRCYILPSRLAQVGFARISFQAQVLIKSCYILPSRLAQDSPRKQFEIVPEPLSKAIGVHFAGQEGWNFCNSLPMYLLEESKSKPIELHPYKQNV
ncbi:unnamed protein product [Nippostrongylus brasiliensis]|uniref:Peptidase A1 domain-containing protein n=1 Tax=Nippostrongylus brasiliensis TaxID=27835 RepID=A0A0N4YQP9_NIPBR|nr:unnamed protein product [Nippostrongylus brasiliensis]